MIDINQFLNSFGHPVRRFPPSLSRTYMELLEGFRGDPDAAGFDECGSDDLFKDPTSRGVANRMFWWFPAHFFKFQDTLLQWEAKRRKVKEPFLLDRPQVTFVDLGCGAGAASAALLSILEQYQMYRRMHNALVVPVRVNLIALDPSPKELDTYRNLINSYTARNGTNDVSANLTTICQQFPEGTPEIISRLSPLRGHVLIVGMSNLIKWIWNDWDKHWHAKDIDGLVRLTSAEATALEQIAEQVSFDYVHVLGVATTTRKWPFLPEKLSALVNKIIDVFRQSRGLSGKRWSSRTAIVFENPQGSGWARRRSGGTGTSKYFAESLVSESPAYQNDGSFRRALALDSLEIAWVKMRTFMRYESLVDHVEIALLDHMHEEYLRWLQATCLERDYACLNVAHDMPYPFPKDDQSARPRSLARMDEQIVSAAIGFHFAKEFAGQHPRVSYSYKFAPLGSEFLYEYWFESYRKYLAAILKRLDEHEVFTTDIKSFYPSVSQMSLQSEIRGRLSVSERCFEILEAIITRDCHQPHPPNYGLVQGHALSGIFANVFLQKADAQLVIKHRMDSTYSRFTDDITVTGVTKPREELEKLIEGELQNVDNALKLNPKKTACLKRQDYSRRIQGSKVLNSQATRFRALILPLFVTTLSYRREFNRQPWQFVYQYQRLLESIGTNFSPEWLFRKIDEYMRPGRWIRALDRRWKLTWPAFSLTSTASGQSDWCQEFENKNSLWMNEKGVLKQNLTSLLIGAAHDLLSKRLPEDQLRRRVQTVKFAIYRLSIFGVSGAVDEIVRLVMLQPWSIPVNLSCQALARGHHEDALRQIYQGSNSIYVRAIALSNMGKLRTADGIALLTTVLDNPERSEPEKLMASEALLHANMWHGISIDRIMAWHSQEMNQPYVHKNIVLILAQTFPHEAHEFLLRLSKTPLHPIVRLAIHYALTKSPAENLLWQAEPEIIRKYRAKSYPIIEELLSDEGSYALVSK